MKIGLFTTDFPFRAPFSSDDDTLNGRQWGGVAEVIYHLALRLNSRGHTVKVFTVSPNNEDIVQEHERITVYRYKKDVQVASTMMSLGLLWKPIQHDLDVVHGHLGTPPGALAALAYSKARSRPLITTVHTTYNDVSLQGGSSARRLAVLLFMHGMCSPLLTATDTITAVSEPVMKDSPAYREHLSRTMIIPNGIDLSKLNREGPKEECKRRLGIPPSSRLVIYVGSLSDYKDPRTLLNAFIKVGSKEDNAYLAMIGDGPLRAELTKAAKEQGMDERIRFPGFVSEEEKARYYGAADIFAIPSLGDAFGLVVLEAAAFGLPIVASDLEAFRSLVTDGHDGLLFKRREVDDLATKLDVLIRDDELRAEMGHNARSTAERYEWNSVLDRYAEVYALFAHR